MSPLSIAVLSLSMSADAFAAAIGRGASHRPTPIQALRAGAVFGIIETLTPILGWALGLAAAAVIEAVDHWIAFALLVAVGGHMIWHSFKEDDAPEGAAAGASRGLIALVATAVGTSIDAAAVGVSLAFLQANILIVAGAIGLTTFVLATLGMLIGRAAGPRLGARAELVGGIALVLLGLKIVLEHLGVLG